MNWIGEYIIELSGLCRWNEGPPMEDRSMAETCQSVPAVNFIMTTCAELGVKTGMA